MSYYPIGHPPAAADGNGTDDFSDLDPATYGGGYDISLTYGRSLPPSLETCYPYSSSKSNNFDYNRPQYSSHAKPSAYAKEALDNEYKSYARPKPRPGPPTPADEYGFSGPMPNYGMNPASMDFGSQHGRIPQYENFMAGHGFEKPEPHYSMPGYTGPPGYPRPGYPDPSGFSRPGYPDDHRSKNYGDGNFYDEEKRHHHRRRY